jgi:hypothetical protein
MIRHGVITATAIDAQDAFDKALRELPIDADIVSSSCSVGSSMGTTLWNTAIIIYKK